MEISYDEKFLNLISIVNEVVINQKELSEKYTRNLKTSKFLARRLKTGMTYLSEHYKILLKHGFQNEQDQANDFQDDIRLLPTTPEFQFKGICHENSNPIIEVVNLISPFELQQINNNPIYNNHEYSCKV